MMRRSSLMLGSALTIVLVCGAVRGEDVVDSCSSLLGSLGVELRFAHRLSESERSTFVCPRDTSALVGASKQRVLNALGSPDATARPDDGEGGLAWYYYFGPKPAANQDRDPRQPELRFDFDPAMAVAAVHCRQHH